VTVSLLQFTDSDEPFAMGAVGFVTPRESEEKERITVNIEIEGLSTMAILDTGAPYSICDREIADQIGFDPDDGVKADPINMWAGEMKGTIHRVNLSLLADEGESLFLDVPVFVPDTENQEFVAGFPPSFLGLIGCLQSMRFAIDPFSQTFYFGKHPE
jgi:hypothetical protein